MGVMMSLQHLPIAIWLACFGFYTEGSPANCLPRFCWRTALRLSSQGLT